MININGISWEELAPDDIEKFIERVDGETFFFEFKSDNEEPAKLVKEISALANTYGGYIFLGVNDNKTIDGCKKWTEQRIHTTVHDSITPVPQFDIKQFTIEGKIVLILKIEEGTMPPYITNKGCVYERVSSGSFPIKESSKLTQLHQKREDQINKIRKKIELPAMRYDNSLPVNLCGYVDLGFSMTLSESSYLQRHFYDYDLTQLHELAEASEGEYHISKVGYSYMITMGICQPEKKSGTAFTRLGNGINNFIEIMCDGSVRARALIVGNDSDNGADIVILQCISAFKKFYKSLFQNDLPEKFISAQKYQKLTVIKQFVANFESLMQSENSQIQEFYCNHVDLFGEPLIVEGNRIPAADFHTIDKRLIEETECEYNIDTLIEVLFENVYDFVGYTP